ncbi:hypothetical protein RSAG8_10877, partial [Rhizoctonia solani AG-8 WAC10335]
MQNSSSSTNTLSRSSSNEPVSNSPQRSSSAGRRDRGTTHGDRGHSPNICKLRSSSNGQQDTSGESQEAFTRVQATTEFTISSSLKIWYIVAMQTPLHASYCLKGRSTTVFCVTDASDATDTLDDSPTRFVARLCDRLKNEEIIKQARGVTDKLYNHLPFVAGARDIDPLSTL